MKDFFEWLVVNAIFGGLAIVLLIAPIGIIAKFCIGFLLVQVWDVCDS